MNKKIALSISACAILSSSLFADTQSISASAGWNLVGSGLNSVAVSASLTDVTTAWAWDNANAKWKVYSPKTELQSSITTLVSSGSVSSLETLNAGDGFWVNSATQTTIQLTGVTSTSNKSLGSGWNLISFTGTGTKAIANVFGDSNAVYTVWEYDNGWKAWSPSNYVLTAIKNTLGETNVLSEVSDSKGYWVNTQIATVLPLDITPPSTTALENLIFVTQMGEDQTVVPLGGVELYVDGNKIGETNSAGEFDFSALKLANGTTVTATKNGMTTTTGTIQNGILVLSLASLATDSTNDTTVSSTLARVIKSQATVELNPSSEGDDLSLPIKIIKTPTGDTFTLDTAGLTKSISATATVYSYPEQVPTISNNIILPDSVDINSSFELSKTIKPEELSIIGGINLTIKDAKKKPILPSEYDSLGLKYRVLLKNIIGDFEKIVTGLTGETTDKKFKLNQDTLTKFLQAEAQGLVSFYALVQNIDGSYEYLDGVQFAISSSGVLSVTFKDSTFKNKIGTANIVFAIRSEAVTGTTKICLDNGGERMFDGSIINVPTSATPVEGAIIIGDEHVTEQPAATDASGCTDVKYKVPFLSPMYQVTAVKSGMYNKPITTEIEFGNLNTESNATMLAKPTATSIVGYVKSSINGSDVQPEGDAIVTLRDPQILVPEKIMVNDSEDNRSITLETAPNLTYTWSITQVDSAAGTKELKTGDENATNNAYMLTQSEVEEYIFASNSPWVANPYGHYMIDVKVEHSYSNAPTLTENMTIEFDAKVDEVALKDAFSFSANGSGIVYKVADGVYTSIDHTDNTAVQELIENNVGLYTIYGGKEISKFKALRKAFGTEELVDPDTKTWMSDVIGAGTAGESYCTDVNSNADYKANPWFVENGETYTDAGYCFQNVLPQTKFSKSLLPFAQVYKMFYDNYPTMISNDPLAGKPWYQSGFTVLNTYRADFDAISVKYAQFANSYTDLGEDKFTSVNDFSNILNFSMAPNEAIAFSTRVEETDTDGSYRLDNVPPSTIPYLELMARAEGTKYNTKNFRKADYPDSVFTGNLGADEIPAITETATAGSVVTAQAGDVLVHNFMLDRVAPTVSVPTSIMLDFENNVTDNTGMTWEVVKLNVSGMTTNTSDSVTWNVVSNDSLPAVNTSYQSYTNPDVSNILATIYGENYIWMGDISTGTYSDSGQQSGTKAVATALKSPLIDFTNYSLATLSLKTWFEVSGQDAAWDTAFIGFEIEGEAGQTSSSLTWYNGMSWNVKVGQTYVKRITPKYTVQSTYNYDAYTNNGLDTIPSWADYQLPLDFLAGKKAKIVFGFFTGDTAFNNYRGWGIDNIEITDNVSYVISMPPAPQDYESEIAPVYLDTNTTELVTPPTVPTL